MIILYHAYSAGKTSEVPEPPDGVGTGVLELPGVGGQHEDVPLGDTGLHDDVSHGDQEHFGDFDGQGSPRPSQ